MKLTKENILEAISIARLIVDKNLVGSQLYERDDEEIKIKNIYNSIIKPKIEEFKSNNNGNTPNQLLNLYLEEFIGKKGYSDKFDVKGFHYKGQVVNAYVWAAITKKAVSRICCKFEVNFLYTVFNFVLPIWNFLPYNFLRFMILQKNRHTAQKKIAQLMT